MESYEAETEEELELHVLHHVFSHDQLYNFMPLSAGSVLGFVSSTNFYCDSGRKPIVQ